MKGQIHSQVINDVKSERYKSDSNTIERTYLIKIGDRYHSCVASEDFETT